MKARFEIRSIKSQWKPPFNKDITDEVFDVCENEQFDRIVGNGNDESVFKLISANEGKAKVQYSRLFTLKNCNASDHTITIGKDETISMTYLWGEDGITKKITFKGMGLEKAQKIPDKNTSKEEQKTEEKQEPKKTSENELC